MREREVRERQRLDEQHSRELEKNLTRWQSPVKLRQYNRASGQLVLQRKQLESLLQQCRFDEAELVQRSLERFEVQERQNAFKSMQHDYSESVRKLSERHQSEMKTLEANARVRMTQFLQRREAARFTFLNKQRTIEKRGEDAADREKVWAMAQAQRLVAISKGSAVRKPKPASQPGKEARVSTIIDLPRLEGNLKPPRRQDEAQTARF